MLFFALSFSFPFSISLSLSSCAEERDNTIFYPKLLIRFMCTLGEEKSILGLIRRSSLSTPLHRRHIGGGVPGQLRRINQFNFDMLFCLSMWPSSSSSLHLASKLLAVGGW